LGKEFASAALKAINNSGLNIKEVDLIGSHGQTVWHQIDEKGNATSTLQIGDISVIAADTGITTIGEFRNADIAFHGQGAPLTSTLDVICLRPSNDIKGYRALQNIGGIGNVTFVSSNHEDKILSFDTGPGNVLIDWFILYITEGEKLYDVDGLYARSGKVNKHLLKMMMEHPYIQRTPPKTTGRELYTFELGQKWLNYGRTNYSITNEDFAATITEYTVATIVKSYKMFSPGPINEVILSGGGANNVYLVERINDRLKKLGDVDVKMQKAIGFDGESKEAILFAFLAYLTYNGVCGNIASCTGSSQPTILGKIAPGLNFNSIMLKNSESI